MNGKPEVERVGGYILIRFPEPPGATVCGILRSKGFRYRGGRWVAGAHEVSEKAAACVEQWGAQDVLPFEGGEGGLPFNLH